jgi:hypothetical protein
MKKTALVLLAIMLLGCFITNAAEAKQHTTFKKNLTIEQLNIQTTALYIKLINSVKPTTVAIQNADCNIDETALGIKNDKSLEPIDSQITSVYTKLINAV